MTTTDGVVFRVTDLRVSLYAPDEVPSTTSDQREAEDDLLPPTWRPAIRGVSFEVCRGEVLSIVGESSSGKTLSMYAALRLLSGGAEATGGIVELFDQAFDAAERVEKTRTFGRNRRRRVAEADDGWRRTLGGRVGILFQDAIGSWTPQFTIGDQSGEALEEHTDLSREQVEQRVRGALGDVKLPRRGFSALPSLLSRGQAQRAMLAQAIVKAPDLLIADEPLTGLDPTTAASILALLRDMRQKRGMAMVFITHDLARAASISDRIAVMYAGRIVETGPVQQVFRHPRHPYTEGLIGSLPGYERDRLRPIRGAPPRLLSDEEGCSFRQRCNFAISQCEEVPPLVVRDGSAAACWLQDEIRLQGMSTGE
jgi:oligopeptide/dipeptide ABC transporter ATP-binding protein